MSTFDRTICMCKETMADGTKRLRILGWEFVGGGISQRPFPISAEGSTTKININEDMYFDPQDNLSIDPVVGIEFYDSEAAITNAFDNVTAMYDGTNPSGELGYPRL